MTAWPNVTLGEIAGNGQYGLNAAGMSDAQGIRFIRITDITDAGELRERKPAFVSANTPRVDEYELGDGDVLIARSGATAGKSYVHQSLGERAVFAGYLIRFQPDITRVLPRYIGAFLQTPQYWRQLNSHKRAVAQPNVNAKQLASLVVPLPPLEEQARIVRLLDETHELIRLRAKADAGTRDLMPAVFHSMFGRFVESSTVTVSLEDKVAPAGWRWCRLTDIARLATGHTPSRKKSSYWKGDIPWISLTDIRRLDGTVAKMTEQSVTEEGIENSSAVKLPSGTVCFSRTASVGFITVMGREMCTSQDFVNWVCSDDLSPLYLMGALMHSREYLRSLASGSTHKTIYFPAVEQFCVLVPPISSQQKYAEHFTAIGKLQADQAESRDQLNNLLKSMLHYAFDGKL